MNPNYLFQGYNCEFMIIKKLHLYSNQIEAQKIFFEDILGFEIDLYKDESFAIQVGNSQLIFEKNKTQSRNNNEYHSQSNYHYCFLIPRNKLKEAKEWMQQKVNLIADKTGQVIYDFESWNAASFYFRDADGNIAEFIARYDLDNDSNKPFDISQIISVNEIGMPTSHVKDFNQLLSDKLGTKFWKGDLKRFGTNGDQHGLFLLVNPDIKKTWFPTKTVVSKKSFKAIIESNDQLFNLQYDGASVAIKEFRSSS